MVQTVDPLSERSPEDDIDEIFPRIFMSGDAPPACLETLLRSQITHILVVTRDSKPKFESQGITYLVLDEIYDNDSQNIV